ncbi:snRNA-activating protein complex subunit [Anaeramoeba flamelloides]|uniref:snRNA-activating protein complex subunit n=1 Tax=Anaeramoeba flamelloides TaxID=1746091 RepID=A0AAV7YSJ9_9EUKA|nr:snRNA-activating protein complex subunit [Anaeramoeba flamelloides]
MAVKKYNGKNWEKVSQYFLNKSRNKCLHRWKKVLHPSLKKGKWSKEEDEMLKKYQRKYTNNWKIISKHLKNRTSKQCRERWKNSLDPNLKKGKWSEKEDQILIEKHSEYGNSWSQIQKFLPGRSANLVKNHWNSKFSKKIVSNNHFKKKRKKKRIVHIGRKNFPSNLKNKIISQNQIKKKPNKPKKNTNKKAKENNNNKLDMKTKKQHNKKINPNQDNFVTKKKCKLIPNKNYQKNNQQRENSLMIQHPKKSKKKNTDCLITNKKNSDFKARDLQVLKNKNKNKNIVKMKNNKKNNNNNKNKNNSQTHQNILIKKRTMPLNNETTPKTPKKTKDFFNTSLGINFSPLFNQLEQNDTIPIPNSQPIDDLDNLDFKFEISPIKKPKREFSCLIRKRKTLELENFQINNLKENFLPNLDSIDNFETLGELKTLENIETLDGPENFNVNQYFEDFNNISDNENIYEINEPVKIQRKHSLKNKQSKIKHNSSSSYLPPISSSDTPLTKQPSYKLNYLKENQSPNIRLNSQNINTRPSNFENNIMNKENEFNPIIFNTFSPKKNIFNSSPTHNFYLSSFPQNEQLVNIPTYLFSNFGNSKPNKHFYSEHPNTTILFQPIKHLNDQKND